MPNPLATLVPNADIPGVAQLAELALDLRSTWNHSTDELWGRLDPELWALTHSPWVVLQTVARTRLLEALREPAFNQRLESLAEERRSCLTRPGWFQQHHPEAQLGCVAYFSMEFGLSEALPIYSGGLGNVAGDQLKAAHDLGVPVVGIGLLYQQGYFRQVIEPDGSQRALYPQNSPSFLPVTPVREPDGEWLRLEVVTHGRKVFLRAWQAKVGRTTLYLLDSNDPANSPADRGITSELYGGGLALRLTQEIALGIGGWFLMRRLGLGPDVCHLNEGHAAFAVLERARCFMEDTGKPFDVALAVTRAGNLFTTHTPVAAGFDRFDPALITRTLGGYARKGLGISVEELLALGRERPADQSEPFNMAHLAIRGSLAVNGVSRLHGAVSRSLFQSLFPRWPTAEVPIGHVTNGVHVPTWDSEAADTLWTRVCGKDRWTGTQEGLEARCLSVSDADLWTLRASSRRILLEAVRERLRRQLAAAGAPMSEIDAARTVFSPDALTLGFARRFATYKRPNLLLHDPDRLLRLLTNGKRPVQLVVAGKAHPADVAGQAMVKAWIEFIRQPAAAGHVVFLADYDMLLAEQLVEGVDVWINTPRRPWEASGTSGMKVLVNGGLNLSELDGWWAEAYDPGVGWALGDGREHGDDPAWDAAEAVALYDLLEQQVVPEFYRRSDAGIPTDWVARMRQSMATLTPRFSANRTVREYTERYYLPLAARYHERAANRGAAGVALLEWRRALAEHWAEVRFGETHIDREDGMYRYHLHVQLGGLPANAVLVELYAEGQNGQTAQRLPMTRAGRVEGSANGYVFTALVPATRPLSDWTPRVIPDHPGAAVPLEAAQILWAR
jgi:glycogen phosphorylase